MKKSSKQLVEMAGSLEELATMICGHGSFAYHNDDRDYPIRKEAVLEYLEMGESFSKRNAVEMSVSYDLEEEIEKWSESFKNNPVSMGYKETARHFADWQKQKDNLPTSKDLEDLVEQYCNDCRMIYDGVPDFAQDLAIYVANWQKQQLMKDAKEAQVILNRVTNQTLVPTLSSVILDETFHEGEKVKIIIIKED